MKGGGGRKVWRLGGNKRQKPRVALSTNPIESEENSI